MKHRKAYVLLMFVMFGAFMPMAGCRDTRTTSPTTAPAGDVVRMQIGSETFSLEIADSDDEQEQGLMARDSMPADRGMIFVFTDARKRAFWMKNTLIPLDIVYIDETGRVVSVKPMQPQDLTPVRSDFPAMYAIELNQGAAARVGIKAGDLVTIPSLILDRQSRR